MANMSQEIFGSILDVARRKFEEIVREKGLADVDVTVLAKPLTPEEAIGKPGRRDFPIIKGKERVIEASVLGTKGHAFTDSVREFTGTLKDVLALSFETNQNRAVFVATMNATLNHLDIVRGTVHCKDDEPEQCAREIADLLLRRYGRIRVGLIGMNPAIAEKLVKTFGSDHVKITDLAPGSIGSTKFGAEVWDGASKTEDLIESSEVILLTGTTIINGTFDSIWDSIRKRKKICIPYGVTISGVSKLMGIERVCPYAHDK